jgi:carbonic anhydrase/acetyltransferase-like protein (isoleucine patch superfamily)
MPKLPHIGEVVMPTKGREVFIALNANVLGDVKIGPHSSVWYGATLRGEELQIDDLTR